MATRSVVCGVADLLRLSPNNFDNPPSFIFALISAFGSDLSLDSGLSLLVLLLVLSLFSSVLVGVCDVLVLLSPDAVLVVPEEVLLLFEFCDVGVVFVVVVK